MLIIEMAKIEINRRHIGFMLIVEMAKIESMAATLKLCLL